MIGCTFKNCTSLLKMTIPKTVSVIWENAFEDVPYHGSASGARWGANSMN